MISASELKAAVNPVEVIERYMALKPSGGQWTGKCPFHDDHDPSFRLNKDGLWHCFACGDGGDVLRFIERIEGVTFRGAMKKLGEIAGIEISGADLADAGLEIKLAGAELRAFDLWVSLRKRRLQHRYDCLEMDRQCVLAFLEEFFSAVEVPAKAVETAHERLNQVHDAKAAIEANIIRLEMEPAAFIQPFLASLYGDPSFKSDLLEGA